MKNRLLDVKRIFSCLMIIIMALTVIPFNSLAVSFGSYESTASDETPNSSDSQEKISVLSEKNTLYLKGRLSIKDAYKSVLMYFAGLNYDFVEYMIYDVDKDGTTELIMYYGTCEADSEFLFYSYNGTDAFRLGAVGASHSWLYGITNANGVYQQRGIQGWESLYVIKKINNTLKIITKYDDIVVDDYTDIKNPLPSFDVHNWTGIDKKAVSKPFVSSCTLSATKYVYDGKVKTPTVIVKNSSGATLKNGTDYTVTYASGRKNIGRYSVKVTYKGNYSGSKTLAFDIVPAATKGIAVAQTANSIKAAWKAVSGITGYQVALYKGSKLIKSVITSGTNYTFTSLASGTTYKVIVKAYKTVNGKNFWSASKSRTTATKPGTPTLTVTAGTKKASLKWNKQTGATGYVVYMATSKTGKYSKIATLKGNSAVSFTKTGLTKGRTYYFKVAAYKTVGSTTLYGSFSAVKAVKVK